MEKKTNTSPLVSILVTAYNAEEYIEGCLRSLFAQSYQNLEIIIVDDGSTDRTGSICDSFADERLRVIHKPNGGVSSARNAALAAAHGDYLAFVDSDDYVTMDYIEVLLRLAREYDADVVCCDFRKTHELPREFHRSRPASSEPEITDGKTIRSRLYTTQRMYYMICWNKLYRKGMFDGLTFPEGLLHEDEDVLAKLFGRAGTVVSSSQVLYYYYMSPNSIMRGPYQPERMGILLTYRKRMRMFAAEGNRQLEEVSRRQCMVSALMQYYLCRRDPRIDARFAGLCLRCFRELLPKALQAEHISAFYKLFFRIADRLPYPAGWLIDLKCNRLEKD